jgi:hypothetical protein
VSRRTSGSGADPNIPPHAQSHRPVRLPSCAICGNYSPAYPPGQPHHRACAEASDLGYDPVSDYDARAWLDARRESSGLPLYWTVAIGAHQ